jgi:hypothetical protein
MVTEIFADEVTKALADMQAAARGAIPKIVLVDGETRSVPYPFPWYSVSWWWTIRTSLLIA